MMEGCGMDLSLSGQGELVGFCKYDNEPSDSIKCRAFFD